MIRILFVEDDPVVMANMRRSLAVMRREWDMRFFATAEDALLGMADRPFDVVVTDLAMPGMDGTELLALVQYQHPRVVRVLMAEPDAAGGMVRAAGVAHRILRKPCDPSELAFAIQRAFELEQRLSDPDLQSMISEVGALPSPSLAVVRLNDLFAFDEVDVDDVAGVVSSDVGMTAKLLQVVNSAYFSLAHHITDVREAVSYLGLDVVRNLCVAMELMKSFEQAPPTVQAIVDEIHEHSLTVAGVARELIQDRTKANDAFVGAMLHDVGLLVLATQLPEQFLELRVQTMRSNLPLTEVELEVIGAHHADIGAHLLDLWGLPSTIVEAVARHHDAFDVPSTGLEPVHAVHIADAVVSGRLDAGATAWEQDGELSPALLERLGIDERMMRLALP